MLYLLFGEPFLRLQINMQENEISLGCMKKWWSVSERCTSTSHTNRSALITYCINYTQNHNIALVGLAYLPNTRMTSMTRPRLRPTSPLSRSLANRNVSRLGTVRNLLLHNTWNAWPRWPAFDRRHFALHRQKGEKKRIHYSEILFA